MLANLQDDSFQTSKPESGQDSSKPPMMWFKNHPSMTFGIPERSQRTKCTTVFLQKMNALKQENFKKYKQNMEKTNYMFRISLLDKNEN